MVARDVIVLSGSQHTPLVTGDNLNLPTSSVSATALFGTLPLTVIPSATETTIGGSFIATTAEITAGADDSKIVTPAKLAAALAGKLQLATVAQTITGTDGSLAVSALGAKELWKTGHFVQHTKTYLTGFVRALAPVTAGALYTDPNTQTITLNNTTPITLRYYLTSQVYFTLAGAVGFTNASGQVRIQGGGYLVDSGTVETDLTSPSTRAIAGAYSPITFFDVPAGSSQAVNLECAVQINNTSGNNVFWSLYPVIDILATPI
jgi:hypothetical protein